MEAKKLFICFLVLLGTLQLFSQEIIGNLINSQNGLADNNNNYILKDSKGSIWISSHNTLNRANGRNITQFSKKDGIGEGYIQGDILEDDEGNIWFATFAHINIYKRSSKRFEKFQIEFDTFIFENGYRVLAFESNKKYLWLQVANEIVKIDTKSRQLVSRINVNKQFMHATLLKDSNDRVVKIFTTGWHVLAGFTEIIIDAENPSIQTYYPSLLDREDKAFSVTTIQKVDEQLLFGTKNNGVYKTDLKLKSIKQIIPETFGSIKNILSVNNEFLLFGTKNSGILVYSKSKNQIIQIISSENGLLGNNVVNLEIIDGYVYVSIHKKGIQIIPLIELIGQGNKIKKYKLSTSVRSINKIDENIYITTNDSIYKYHSKPNGYLQNTCNISMILPGLDGLISYSTDLITKIKNGTIVSLNKIPYISYAVVGSDNNHYLSGPNKPLIFNTENNELDTLDFNNEKKFSAPEFSFPFKFGQIIKANSDSLYWLQNTQIKSYFFNTYVDHIVPAKDDILFCTPNGLFTFNQSGGINQFGKNIWQFFEEQIFNVIEYEGGYILVNKHGVFRYYTHSNTIYRYDIPGPFNRTTYNGIAISENKDIVLGSDNLLYVFNPDSLNMNTEIPKMEFSEFAINGIPSKRRNDFFNTKEIKLKNKENDISFKINVNDNINPDLSRVKISINGKNSILNSDDILQLNNLASGKHRLSIIGFNSYHNISQEEIFKITITPPIYERWWFILGMSVCLISIGWYINYQQARKQLKAQQIEMDRKEAVHKTRELIARDLHDDLGTELNKILFLADDLQYQKDEDEKIKLLDRISTLAGESIKSMRDMLWVLNTQNESLGKLTTRLRQTMFKNLKEYNIKLISDLPPNHDDVILSNQFMKNIHLICKEATNNCIKYAEAYEVQLTIKYENHNLDITIKDNGKGFEGEIRSDAYGVENMKKRAEEMGGKLNINSTKGQGVLVHLNLDIPEDHIV